MAAAAGDVDRLSDLPDNILHHILSFLDTLSIVETSILARRWRCLWKDVPILNIWRKYRNSSTFSFKEHISKLLSLRSHHVAVAEVNFDYCRWGATLSEKFEMFDSVMKYAASQSLGNGGGSHLHRLSIVSPSTIDFTDMAASIVANHHHDSLKTLKLTRMNLVLAPTSGFMSLTALELFDCCLGPNTFANFPGLKYLKLQGCISRNLKVSGVELVHLEIREAHGSSIWSMEVSAPKLRSFCFRGTDPRRKWSPVLNLPALDHASVHVLWFNSTNGFGYTKEEADRACLKLFSGLHNAESLILCFDNYNKEDTDKNSPLTELNSSLKENEVSPFTRLKTLRVQYRKGSPKQTIPYRVIRYFLDGSPNSVDKSFAMEKIEEKM
ncbi:unnamed protein product [Linum tenue]|uniref:F-box domain-containing protein n=1 Tax=Linum tenue TaxID=586396 RepID=A0AAV0I9C3_9ROSI|nr:unnamed protein product [Linum tenue]